MATRKRTSKKEGANRDKVEVFLTELSRHGSVRKACSVADVSRKWVREKRLEEDFAIAYNDAIEDSLDRVEEAAHSGAIRGDDKLIRFMLEVKRYKKSTDIDLSSVKPVINITVGAK